MNLLVFSLIKSESNFELTLIVNSFDGKILTILDSQSHFISGYLYDRYLEVERLTQILIKKHNCTKIIDCSL